MRSGSRLLMNEPPLMFAPSLAVLLGVSEAIFLQQLHYWLEKSKHEREGFTWVYNTYEEWQYQFPFWSISTIRRTIKSLEEQKIIVTNSFNKMKLDKTKWYRIDYVRLVEMECPSVQIEQSNGSKRTAELVSLNRAIPETTQETTSEKKDSRRKRVYDTSSAEFKIADFFYHEILKNNPMHKKPDLQKWANDIRLLLEIDNRDKSEVSRLIRWVQRDSFEMANVLSPAKLRKRYDALIMKMNKPAEGSKDKPAPKSREVKEFELDPSKGE